MLRVYFGDDLARYGFGDGHPFGPDRIHAFWSETVRRGLDREVEIATPRTCEDPDLALFHTGQYIDLVRRASNRGSGFLDHGDTPAFEGVFEAGSFVVGSGLDGLDAVMSGRSPRVFVPIAGLHHARRDSAGGFCVFNDAGVIIELVRRRHGLRRVAYVDIDAHHGDGVFYSFEDDPDVIIADIHEDGRFLYPGTGFANETGRGAAEGTKLNVPLEPGADDQVFYRVWPRVEEFVESFRPELIILQAGADSVRGDPITHMAFTPAAHAHAAERLCRVADRVCNGRLIAMGGGGYNRNNLALAWNDVLQAMIAA